jgi:hypothetical protein
LNKKGIGPIVMITAGVGRTGQYGPWRDNRQWENIGDPDKAGLDWSLWLGHRHSCAGQTLAPRRPWDPRRFFHYRCYWDYSHGIAGEYFYPLLTALLKATGLQYPQRVVSGGIWVFHRRHPVPPSQGGGNDDREVPDQFHTVIDYPQGPTVHLIGSTSNDTNMSTTLACREATITFSPSHDWSEAVLETQPTSRRKKERTVLKGPVAGFAEHRDNYFRACRDSKTALACPVDLALKASIALGLSVKAFRENRVVSWNSQEMQEG